MSSAKATISATYSPTNRLVTCGEDYGIINTWSKLTTKRELLEHPTYRRISEEFKKIRRLESTNMDLFRGRPKCQVWCPRSARMGPPPPSPNLPGGRYNDAGESVLYLSDSENGVMRELAGKTTKILVQKFQVPINKLRIADLTAYEPKSVVNAIMWHCELAGNQGYPSFIFSQTVAVILKNLSFDGAMVFGVRGDESEKYNNVFIFNPIPRWKSWLGSGSRPFSIRVDNKK